VDSSRSRLHHEEILQLCALSAVFDFKLWVHTVVDDVKLLEIGYQNIMSGATMRFWQIDPCLKSNFLNLWGMLELTDLFLKISEDAPNEQMELWKDRISDEERSRFPSLSNVCLNFSSLSGRDLAEELECLIICLLL
jgi:hypothetical protein